MTDEEKEEPRFFTRKGNKVIIDLDEAEKAIETGAEFMSSLAIDAVALARKLERHLTTRYSSAKEKVSQRRRPDSQ